MLSPSIFGMTGTDAMDTYLTGGVDRPAASGIRITAVAATTTTTTYLHLPPQPPPVTQRKHNNHQNSRHELAPQQEYTWGRGEKKSVEKSRPCSGSTSRSLRAAGKPSASGRLPSRNQQCGKVFTYNRVDLAAGKKKYIRVFTVPFSRGKKMYRPAPSKKNKTTVPSPAVGKNIYRPVPPREKIFTVPARRGKKYLPSRPARGKK